MFELNKSSKKLDIKEYSDLKLRDAKWLIEILNNKKYQYIATEYNITLGAVKNRMKIIFKTLGVGDKQGFLNKYENYEIYYGEKVSSIIQSSFLYIFPTKTLTQSADFFYRIIKICDIII